MSRANKDMSDPNVTDTAMYAERAKVIAIVSLSGGSLFFGLLPIFMRLSERHRQPLLISNLLCFGAGVLLATSLVHMLPEVRDKLPNYAELILCGGFFLVYIVDEMLHAVCGEAIRHTHQHAHIQAVHSPRPRGHSHEARPCYGSVHESTSLLNKSDE